MAVIRLRSVPRLHSDESLNGFVTRLTKNYVFEMPQHLLAAIKIDAAGLSDLHREKALIASFAERIDFQTDELARRRYAPSKRLLSQIQFAGHEIRETAFAGRSPRIPPHTYRELGYHRMCWDLAFVTADPDTGERLISACPNCGDKLRWNRSEFIRCYSCIEPLAKAAPSFAPNDVRLAAAIFSGLLSLDRGVAADARSCIAEDLRRVAPGLLLQSLYELSSRPISERKGRGTMPVTIDWEIGLVRMLQLSIGWPDAILGLIDELTAGGRRKQDKSTAAFKYGRLRKVLPAWGAIPQVHGVAIPLARAMASGEIALYRPHPRFVGAGGVFPQPEEPNRSEAPYDWFQANTGTLSRAMASIGNATVAEELADLASLEMIKIRWGLEKETVLELSEAGYLRRVDNEFRHLIGSDEPLYKLSEIESFFFLLRDRYEAVPRNTRRIGFTSVLSRIRTKLDRPYVRIIKSILDGSFRPIRIKEKARTGFERLQFGVERADEWIGEQLGQGYGARHSSLTAAAPERLAYSGFRGHRDGFCNET